MARPGRPAADARRTDVLPAAVMRRRIAAMEPLAAAALVATVLEQVHAWGWAVADLDRGPAELWDGLVIGGVGAWQVTTAWCRECRPVLRPAGHSVAQGVLSGSRGLVVADAIGELRRRALVSGVALEHIWSAELRAAAG